MAFFSAERWEDHPGKYYTSRKFLRTPDGKDPTSLAECKSLCSAQAGCTAVDYKESPFNDCYWYDYHVPVSALFGRDYYTFSRKINETVAPGTLKLNLS